MKSKRAFNAYFVMLLIMVIGLVGCIKQTPFVSPLEPINSIISTPMPTLTSTPLPFPTSTIIPLPSPTASPSPTLSPMPTLTYPPYSDVPFAVVFHRDYNLWYAEIGTGYERQLTQESAEWPISYFAVSPKGDKIAYTLYKDPPSIDALVKQVDIASGEIQVLTGENDQCSEYGVQWLDATRITFQLQEFRVPGYDDDSCWNGVEPFHHIVFDLTTRKRTFVPESLGLSQSPNGRYWLTGSCYYVYECPLEYVLRDLATGEEWHIAESIGWGRFIDWSPDSQWMLFNAYERGETATPTRLVIVNSATREERQLTADDKSVKVARWSPDGKAIAFTQCDEQECALWVMAKDGSEAVQVPVDVVDAGWYLDWTPDSSRLVFTRENDGSIIWSVRLDGTDLRPIISQASGLHMLPSSSSGL